MGGVRRTGGNELLAQGQERQGGEYRDDEGRALGNSGAHVSNSKPLLDSCVGDPPQDRIDHEGNTGHRDRHDQVQ